MKARYTRAIWSLIVMLLASCSSAPEAKQEPARPELTGVVAEEVRLAAVEQFWEVPGTVRSKASTVIAARTAGQILRVNSNEGDRVEAGQLLAVIDRRDADVQASGAQAGETEALQALDEIEHAIRAGEAALQSAAANRDLAAATLERYRTLRDKRSVSPQEFDEVQARAAAAQAETGRAAETLEALKAKRSQIQARINQARAHRESAALYQEYSQVLAPATGVVTRRHVEPGMIASPGMPLLTVEDNLRYQLELSVEESRLVSLKIGTPVRARIDALGTEGLSLRVNEILPAADPATRTLTVRLNLPPRAGLRSGLFGRAYIPSGTREMITIPESLVVRRGQLTGVFVLENQTVRHRLITLGSTQDGRVEVLSGLSAGDRIITSPQSGLEDGRKARP